MTTPILSDGVVVLDRLTLADVDAHLAGEDEEHARRFGWWPERSTRATVAAAIERWAREWDSGGSTRTFGVRVGGELVGGCEIRADGARGAASYWTFPRFRGRGYAARALRLLCAYAFDELGVEAIELVVAPDNVASHAVARACGFAQVGRRDDDVVYELHAREMLAAWSSR